jgi:hypothetical protein
MEQFFRKHSGNFDEGLAMDYINRQMSNFQSEGGSSGGGQSSRHQDGGQQGEEKYEKLAKIHEMIEDLFESKGLDPRSFVENQRRGR